MVEVRARLAARGQDAGEDGELLADLRAGGLAGALGALEPLAGLEDERLDLVALDAEDLGDLVVPAVLELEEDERRALVLGQALDVADEVLEVAAALDLGGEAVGAGQALEGVVAPGDVVTARAQDAEAAVAGDRVEPRLQLDRLPAAPEAVVGRDEHLLEGVLGLLLVAQHVAAERQELRGMALVDDLEGRRIAGPDLGDEPGVTTLVDGPLPEATAGRQVDRGGRHVVIMPPFTSTVPPLVRMSHESPDSPHAGRDPRASLPEVSLPGCDDVPPGLLPLVVVAPDVAPCLPELRSGVLAAAEVGPPYAETRRAAEGWSSAEIVLARTSGGRSRGSRSASDRRGGPARSPARMASPPRPADFPHHLAIPTRWNDNDVYGHVNNVEYYAFFDTVINHFLIEEGGLDIHAGPVIGVCAESHCRYHGASTFPEVVDAGLRVGKLGTLERALRARALRHGRAGRRGRGLVRARLRRPRPRAGPDPRAGPGCARALERLA